MTFESMRKINVVSAAETITSSSNDALALGAVEELFVPCHLDGFKLRFVGLLRIALEVRQFDDVAVEIGEAHGQRIGGGVRLGKEYADVFGIVPCEFSRHKAPVEKRSQR